MARSGQDTGLAEMLGNKSTAVSTPQRKNNGLIAGLILGLAFFLISTWLAYSNIQALREADKAIRHTH